jgi:predicted DNA-binding protein with PD1-like motif
MQFRKTKNGFLIRLIKGEEIISSLSGFVEEQKILGGFIFGLGAFRNATLGYFDSAKKEYVKNSFEDDMEFGSLNASISYVEGKPFIHAHVVAAGSDAKACFGHLFSATISATGEFFIIPSDVKIERKADPDVGLNLLDLS